VAVFATITELSSVNIRVAVGAGRADISELHIFVAAIACDRAMRPEQPKARFLMLEDYGRFDYVP
jgi:hypothetical protein